MAATLKMIAERAGLSPSTVSQILNRRSNDFSSEKTRELVFRLAREMGYKQKFGHKLLRGDRTHTVAILLGMHRLTLEEHIQSLVMILLTLLEREGWGSYLVTLGETAEENVELVRDLLERGTESFIFLGDPAGTAELERTVSEQKRSFVGYASALSRNVLSDSSESTAEIIRYFLAEGRRNFRCFFGTPSHSKRLDGLRRVFPDLTRDELETRYLRSLECGDVLGETDDIDTFARMGYRATQRAFEEDPRIDACFYLSDYFAVGGLRYLVETNRKVGSDVLVAGFNDIHAVRNYPFPVSSAAHDIPLIASVLIEEMTKEGPLTRLVPTRAVIRK